MSHQDVGTVDVGVGVGVRFGVGEPELTVHDVKAKASSMTSVGTVCLNPGVSWLKRSSFSIRRSLAYGRAVSSAKALTRSSPSFVCRCPHGPRQPHQVGVVGDRLTAWSNDGVLQPDSSRHAQPAGVSHERPARSLFAVQQTRSLDAEFVEILQDLVSCFDGTVGWDVDDLR